MTTELNSRAERQRGAVAWLRRVLVGFGVGTRPSPFRSRRGLRQHLLAPLIELVVAWCRYIY
jgi:hypothetical protein